MADPWAAFPDAPLAPLARSDVAEPINGPFTLVPELSNRQQYATLRQSKSEQCVAQCLHLLPSPSGDLRGSEFSRCYHECMGYF